MMLTLRSGILAKGISIASTSLQQRQSISLASFLLRLHFRNSCQLFCKKHVLKNFAESCKCFLKILQNFKEHFFSQNTSNGCFWHFHQSRFPILILYVINQQLRCEYVQFLSIVENGRAKDFIYTCIFLRMITFFIEIQMSHRIFSISFNGSKFNENLIILKTMFIIYVIDLSTKNKM